MAKVRKFSLDVPTTTSKGQVSGLSPQTSSPAHNTVPDIPKEAVDRVTANAPIQIRRDEDKAQPGNPRKRRYKQKTYSLLQEDIDRIENLVATIRSAGLYDRGRSDIVRAGVALLQSLPLEDQVRAVQAVENLRNS